MFHHYVDIKSRHPDNGFQMLLDDGRTIVIPGIVARGLAAATVTAGFTGQSEPQHLQAAATSVVLGSKALKIGMP